MRRPVVRAVLAVLAVGVLVGAGAFAGYALWLRNEFDGSRHTIVHAFPTSRPPLLSGEAGKAQNLLLIGTDTVGAGRGRDGNGDTMVVAHVDGDRRHVTLVAIPRHALLDVPGHGRVTARSALALGGVRLAVQTVERLVGVRMDHFAVVSFTGLVGLTDALGGVTVRNSTAYYSNYASRTFPVGSIRLDGQAALAYVRGTGDPDASGDALRITAQRAYLTAVLGRLLDPSILLNPARSGQAVERISKYLTTDAGLSADYVVGLGFALRDAKANGIGFVALPVAGTTSRVPAAALERIRTAFADDTVARLAGAPATGGPRP